MIRIFVFLLLMICSMPFLLILIITSFLLWDDKYINFACVVQEKILELSFKK